MLTKCQWAECSEIFQAARPWHRFCCSLCRNRAFRLRVRKSKAPYRKPRQKQGRKVVRINGRVVFADEL